uniref:Ig-like domain-containing protein n=1 Tax=Globodera rostochiensis TaxID=31243 RepID=A0A914HHL3_GLORO
MVRVNPRANVRVLSAAGYLETDAPTACASCNSKSPNVRAEWSASTRAPNTCAFYLRLVCGNRSPSTARCAYRAILRTQTCVVNGPRQPVRAQHVRVLSAAGYVETDAPNSMRLSCNSKNPNVRAEWSASTRACPTRARFIFGWVSGNRRPQQHALIVQF